MKKLLTIILLISMNSFSKPLNFQESFSKLLQELYSSYSRYKIHQIQSRRFDVNQYHQILDSLINQSNGLFTSSLVGKSFKNRDIKKVSFGSGKIKILMWSQMHGDESTASLALLNLMNFLISEKEFSQELGSKIALHFVPILNPDGAKEFERRNYQEIDINRDAIRLQTPEGKLLKKLRDEIQPDFAFNLHDQYSNNSVGKTGKPAAIAILAPAFDYDRNINDVRKRAIQVCVEIKDIIEKFYPGVVARYDDEFEPRAFGDNFQKWGSSTILIESGGYFQDFEKQEIRKMNFLALIGSLISIADGNYQTKLMDDYFKIPENERTFFDLLVRNVIVQKDSAEYLVDIGISYTEKWDSLRARYIRLYSITDIGDLSTFFAFDTLNAQQLKFEFGRTYEKILTRFDQLKKLKINELLNKGYTNIIYQGSFEKIIPDSILDLMISTTKSPIRESKKLLGHSANFVLRDNLGKIKFIVINGRVIENK